MSRAWCSAEIAARIPSLEHGVRWERLNPVPEAAADFLEIYYDVGGGAMSGDQAMRHNGREYGLVLEGVLCIQIGFETYTLEAGDSVVFDSTVPHHSWNGGDVPVRAVWFEIKPEPTAGPRGRSTHRCTGFTSRGTNAQHRRSGPGHPRASRSG